MGVVVLMHRQHNAFDIVLHSSRFLRGTPRPKCNAHGEGRDSQDDQYDSDSCGLLDCYSAVCYFTGHSNSLHARIIEWSGGITRPGQITRSGHASNFV